MLMLREHFIGLTVASVQSGLPCGKVSGFVINPDKLSITLIAITDTRGLYYLLPNDIRLLNHERLIIDAEEKLSAHEDLIRYQDVISEDFKPIGCKVVTEGGKRLGKVVNYAIDNHAWLIGKLYITPGLLANPLQQEHIIDRSDVINVEKNRITVRELRQRTGKPLTIPLPRQTF